MVSYKSVRKEYLVYWVEGATQQAGYGIVPSLTNFHLLALMLVQVQMQPSVLYEKLWYAFAYS